MRSFLFVPGDSPNKLAKALASAADALIVDLEDAVSESRKGLARAKLTNLPEDSPKTILVRINALNSNHVQDDLAAVLPSNVQGLVIPKSEHPEALASLVAALKDSAKPLYPLVETALGVLCLKDLVLSGLPLAGLMFGAEDYIASIGANPGSQRHEILFARSSIVNAAAAIAVPAIDTVFTDLGDEEGLARDCELARQLGFSAKLAIHPKQLAVINETWTVRADELGEARALLDAYEEQLEQGRAVFEYQGRMIDEAVVKRARRLVGAA